MMKNGICQKYRDLSSHIWRQRSQPLTVPNYRVRSFKFLKKFKFSVKFLKISQKTSYWGNYKDLSTHNQFYLVREKIKCFKAKY